MSSGKRGHELQVFIIIKVPAKLWPNPGIFIVKHYQILYLGVNGLVWCQSNSGPHVGDWPTTNIHVRWAEQFLAEDGRLLTAAARVMPSNKYWGGYCWAVVETEKLCCRTYELEHSVQFKISLYTFIISWWQKKQCILFGVCDI